MAETPIDKGLTSTLALEDITMPSLGADMTEGTLTQWLVKEGDHVNSGDIIAVLETQKGAIDMEVYSAGTIAEILVAPVAKVQVGTVLARLALTEPSKAEPSKAEPSKAEPSKAEPSKAEPSKKIATPAETIVATANETTVQNEDNYLVNEQIKVIGINASPIVRRLAQEQQLDLSGIQGSGPQGAILLADLSALSKPKTKSSNHDSADNHEQNMRSAIAAAMAKSKQEIPHFYLSLEIDISAVQYWLQQQNKAAPPEQYVLLLALLLKAMAISLVKYPKLNGFYQGNAFEQASTINIGNVISLRQGGLVVPAIHDVDNLSVSELMQGLRDITARSRNGHLRSSELTDATITVTNMGERGADSVLGIIYPPQVAILGFGKVRKVLQLVNDEVKERAMLTASLSADHRVIDGMLAAKFLNHLSKQLQKPERL
ncbi:dihydrolipoamide acetyltransferase family protein [Candidatus Colwellia aromaticivorans]|uniref:dihydrolipoamide acetyltransferase family protein n=1 Tax=Candidatus Colwellia aromaticivorans TaxID=2267621 RepID=UPI001FEB8574|nr:dihydrolipoamide acetyltransferase family protein [Candidatus Colwellia aromaticivorans]